MKLEFTKNFRKAHQKRIQPKRNLAQRFDERLKLFNQDPTHPTLKNHSLIGAKKDLYSISITGDIRAIYRKEDDKYVFMDIGSHNQVY